MAMVPGLSSDLPQGLADAACFYAELGIAIHPLHGVLSDGRCTCGGRMPGCQPGKHPRLRGWQVGATSDRDCIQAWWRKWPQANIGSPVPPGHLVIDVDPRHGGRVETLGVLPPTRMARTGSGGVHVYFRAPDWLCLEDLTDRAKVRGLPGVDLRTWKNYVVLPPSRSAAGTYQWITAPDAQVAMLPEQLLQLIVAAPEQRQRRGSSRHTTHYGGAVTASDRDRHDILAGQRNTWLFRMASALRAKGMSSPAIEAAILAENRSRCTPPLSDEEVLRLVDSSGRYPPNTDEILGNLTDYAIRQDGALIRVDADPRGGPDLEHFVAVAPIRLTGRVQGIEDCRHQLQIAWLDDGIWHEHIAEREEIMNATKLVGLSAFGLPVNSGNARAVMEYLARYEHVNRAYLPTRHVATRLGWHEEEQQPVYLWGHQAIGKATLEFQPDRGNTGDMQLADTLTSAGTLDGWIQAIAPMQHHARALLGVYAALTAPILKLLSVPSFFVNWHCRTSLGKTTTLLAAASTTGKPDGPNGLLQSWNTTAVNIERLCTVSNDVPVLLDDSKSADRRAVGAMLYKAASGVGKGRGNTIGRARVGSWRTVILSTGEGRITEFTADGGARGRVLEVGGLPFGSDRQGDLALQITAGVRRHYGHALPTLVRYLLAHRDSSTAWIRLYERIRRQLARGRSNVADRLATYFAAIRVSGVLFHRACREAGQPLLWHVPTFEDIWLEIAGNSVDADADVRALQHVLSWARSNEESFFGRHQMNRDGGPQAPRMGWAGRWQLGADWEELAFLPSVLKDVLAQGEFHDHEAIKRAWLERGWRRVDSEGRDPQIRWKADEHDRVRLVVLRREAFRAAGVDA